MIGYKVISLEEHPQYSVFRGQTDNDWSAIYIQFTQEHALRYLDTKYESHEHVGLVKILFSKDLEFYEMNNDKIRDSTISSKDKAELVKSEISKKYPIDMSQPLMKELGRFNCCLITYDNESTKEIVVPHSLLVDDRWISYTILVDFVRDPSSIMKTLTCIVMGKKMNLTKDEKNYTSELVSRILKILSVIE